MLQRVVHSAALPLGGDAAQLQRRLAHAVGRDVLPVHDVPGADREGDQIAGQVLGGFEGQLLPALACRLHAHLLGVGDALLVGRDGQADLPRLLEAGLVETREGDACAQRLELRHHVRRAFRFHLVGAGKAAEGRLIDDINHGLAGRQGIRRGRLEHAAGLMRLLDGQRNRLAVGGGDRGRLDIEVATMQPEALQGLCQCSINAGVAAEPILGRIDFQVDRHLVGHHVTRQAAKRHVIGGEQGSAAGNKRRGGRHGKEAASKHRESPDSAASEDR